MNETNGEANPIQRSKTKQNTGHAHCEVCYAPLKKSPAKMQCSTCNRNFCKYHLRKNKDSTDNICVDCFKIQIKTETMSELERELNAYRDDISENNTEKSKIKEDLKIKTKIIQKWSESIKDNENQHMKRIAQLEQKINQETQINCYACSEIDSLEATLKNSKLAEEMWKKKLSTFQEEISEKSQIVDNEKENQDKLSDEINELNQQIKSYIPYGRLRSVTCNDCAKKIKRTFRDEIISGLRAEGRDSLIESVMAAKASIQAYAPPNEASSEKKWNPEEPREACHCIIT
ncbi:unnamed protein product [Blepharisma stoltei]|uniref:E3 ubiquitin-protein ligase CHFR cysteine rich domain-containing protein n=1 Tax=Blepharisma stoltei TaxID=1481888 RepID=A0AAU9KC72_9CILI|nr:unnamed protein product [Blepharisma stoltei]